MVAAANDAFAERVDAMLSEGERAVASHDAATGEQLARAVAELDEHVGWVRRQPVHDAVLKLRGSRRRQAREERAAEQHPETRAIGVCRDVGNRFMDGIKTGERIGVAIVEKRIVRTASIGYDKKQTTAITRSREKRLLAHHAVDTQVPAPGYRASGKVVVNDQSIEPD